MSGEWVTQPDGESQVDSAGPEPADPAETTEPAALRPDLHSGVATWSTAKILPLALTAGVAIAVAVFWISPAPMIIEWQLTILALAAGLCAFLTIGLYRGVELEQPKDAPEGPHLPGGWNIGGFDGVDFSGADLGEGCAVILIVIVLMILAFLALELLFVIVPPILYGLYRLSDSVLRRVFSGRRACTGRWLGSLKLAVGYTGYAAGVLYAGTWIVRVAWLAVIRR